MRIVMLRLFSLVVVAVAFGPAAEAVDLTGTWEGSETCACFNDVKGNFKEKFSDEVMEISQNGTDLNIFIFGERFNGNVINDPRKRRRGVVSLIACNTDPKDNASLGEIGRGTVKMKKNGTGKLKIESFWNVSQTEICTCKWNFDRTDTGDPSIGDCS